MIKRLSEFRENECGILNGKRFIVTSLHVLAEGRTSRCEVFIEDGERFAYTWMQALDVPYAESIGMGRLSVVTTITWPVQVLPGGDVRQDPPTAWARLVGDD